MKTIPKGVRLAVFKAFSLVMCVLLVATGLPRFAQGRAVARGAGQPMLLLPLVIKEPVATQPTQPVRAEMRYGPAPMVYGGVADAKSTIETTSAPTMTQIFLPMVAREYNTASMRADISAAIGGELWASDGTVIEVPAGAFAEDGYLLYQPQSPTSAPPGMQATPRGFELRAFANAGGELHTFAQPIVGRIPYDYTDIMGLDEDTLTVYYFDDGAQIWQLLPSRVDHHLFQVVFSTTHLTTLGLMAQPLAGQDECTQAQVGRNAPQHVRDAMCAAYMAAGGHAAMGDAVEGSAGSVHEWGSTLLAQDFEGGTLQRPILVYRKDNGTAYYMPRPFVDVYYDAGGPDSGFLGLPTSNPYADGSPCHKDDDDDFRDGPTMYFQHGFIAREKSAGGLEAHRFFPKIQKATWTTSWEPTDDTDEQGNPLGKFTVWGTINEAETNPDGKPGDNPALHAGFWVRTEDGSFEDGQLDLAVGETGKVVFSGVYKEWEPYQFYFFVWRDDPDGLTGYYPCNHSLANLPDGVLFRDWMTDDHVTYQYNCDCSGSGTGGDNIPPEITIFKPWKNGEGDLSVEARITDNSGIIAKYEMWVAEGSNGRIGLSLAPFPNSTHGADVYAGTIVDIPSADLVYFMIKASDPSGNTRYKGADSNGRVWFSYVMGGEPTGACRNSVNSFLGNPVNSSLGDKTETALDLVVPGRSGTDIQVQRAYHSQTDYVGPFGKGWSFTYDYVLEEVINRLLDGVHIRYPDGHTANYQHNGSGRYNSITPGAHEYVLREGSGYALHLPDQNVYHFNSSGRLIRIVNARGGEIVLTYDGDGHLKTVSNESGRTVGFTFTSERITSVKIGAKTLTYRYDGKRLIKFVDADGGEWIYSYDGNGFLKQVLTPEGNNKNSQTYNQRGEVQSQTIGETLTLDFQFNRDDRTMTASDLDDNKTVHTHDSRYRLVKAENGRGYTETFKYDSDDNLTRYVDQAGNTWHYRYDANGNMIYRGEPVDGTSYCCEDETFWRYDDENRVISMTNSLGHTTLYDYDAQGNLLHVYYPDGGVLANTYYSDGQLESRTDPNGNTTRYTYYNTGDLWQVIDPLSNTTTYEYDALGRKTAEIDANDNRTEFRYNGRDLLIERVDPYDHSTCYEYDGDGRLTDVWDRNDAHTQYIYAACCGLLTKVIDPEGGVTEYGYNDINLRTWMRDPNGNVTDYRYDEDYNLIEEILPPATPGAERGHVYYSYDAKGNRIKKIDPAGNVPRYVYDASNRLKKVIDAEGHVTEYCYDTEDQLVTTFDPRRAETQTVYDPMGRRVNTIDALGHVFTYTYDLGGRLIASAVPHDAQNGEVYTTRYEYDAAGRRMAVIDPLGNAVRYGYDDVGNTIAITDAREYMTRQEYDANNRLTTVVDALTGTVRYGYDAEGHRTVVTDAMGHVTRYGYDLLGRTTAITEPLGQVTRYEYDPNGNLVAVTNALSGTTTYGYDALNRRIWERDPLGHTTHYSYDMAGNRTAVADAEDNVTRYGYDDVGNLISVTDAISGTTRYAYDEVGNRTVITYANDYTSTFLYNHLDQLIMEVDALGRTWRYAYDDAGHHIRKVDGEWQATYYRYDGAGRLVTTIFGSTGKRIDFEYDPNGNQTAMIDWNGRWTRQFDALNRPTVVTDYLSRTLVYDWNPDGTRASLTYPDGRVLAYDYTDDGRLETLTLPSGQTAEYTYNPLGYLTQLAYSNGVQADYAYDAASRLTSLHNTGPGGAVIAWYDYELDKVSNRVQTTEQRPFAVGDPVATVVRQYEYDDLYRLVRSTSSVSQTHEMSWELDSVGNWVRRYGTPEPAEIAVTEPVTTTYDHNPINALVRAGDWLYEYDRNGSRIAAQAPLTATQYVSLTSTFGLSATLVIAYEYDYENYLVAVHEAIRYSSDPSGRIAVSPTMEARYIYDGIGRRVAKWVTTTITSSAVLAKPMVLHRSYVYDGLDATIEYEERDNTLDSITYYYRAKNQLVALERVPVTSSSELYWTHHDGLRSVVSLSSEGGNLAIIYHYGEYGQLLMGELDRNRYTYTEQEYDAETSWLHFFARYYEPAIGLWVTQDVYRGEAVEPLTLHRYTYVSNSPISQRDIYGYQSCSDSEDCAKNFKPILYFEKCDSCSTGTFQRPIDITTRKEKNVLYYQATEKTLGWTRDQVLYIDYWILYKENTYAREHVNRLCGTTPWAPEPCQNGPFYHLLDWEHILLKFNKKGGKFVPDRYWVSNHQGSKGPCQLAGRPVAFVAGGSQGMGCEEIEGIDRPIVPDNWNGTAGTISTFELEKYPTSSEKRSTIPGTAQIPQPHTREAFSEPWKWAGEYKWSPK